MSEKKETPILVFLLFTAAGLTLGGFWWVNDFPGWKPMLNLLTAFLGNNSLEQSVETFDQVKDIPAGNFKYGGSTTWAPIREQVDPVIEKIWANFQMKYTNPANGNPGSSTGVKMLLNGDLDFSQSSRPLHEQEFQEAIKQGFQLKQIPVGIDDIAIAVHPSLEVPGITVAQIKDIYTGKILNWKEIGGPDLPLIPYSRHPKEGGTVDFFIEEVLGNSQFGSNVVLVPDTTAGLRKVASDPGGLYYASAIQVVPQCSIKPLPIGRTQNELIPPYKEPFIDLSLCPQRRNQLNRVAFHSGKYPITRRLFVIVKENGLTEEQAGKAYAELLLTVQGQKLIEETGFISLHPFDE